MNLVAGKLSCKAIQKLLSKTGSKKYVLCGLSAHFSCIFKFKSDIKSNNLAMFNFEKKFSTASIDLISENEFHKAGDNTLEHIQDTLCPLEESLDDAEVSYSQGVLNVSLGSVGTWVINKQTPNRQLWWSSPISGPRRYEFIQNSSSTSSVNCWKHSKDGSDLIETLSNEILQSTGERFFQ